MVEEAIKRKVLIGNPRSKFITAIAASIFNFKSYPTTEEYEYVTDLVCAKWQFISEANVSANDNCN